MAGLDRFNRCKQCQRHFVPIKPNAHAPFGRCRQFRDGVENRKRTRWLFHDFETPHPKPPSAQK